MTKLVGTADRPVYPFAYGDNDDHFYVAQMSKGGTHIDIYSCSYEIGKEPILKFSIPTSIIKSCIHNYGDK